MHNKDMLLYDADLHDTGAIDLDSIRRDFPILKRKIRGKRLVYLDNAATTQKPLPVIDALANFYKNTNANIHRGIYALSEESTSLYEEARIRIAAFIGAAHSDGVIFTKNATEALNLIALSWGLQNIKKGDEILATGMEHHSNLIPWIMLARRTGATLRHVRVTDDGYLDMNHFYELLTDRTKLVAVTMVSNVLGTITPVAEITKAAHTKNAVVVIDGAQGIPHLEFSCDVIDCDFLAFSAHKMLGPTGVGVLYGKPDILQNVEPAIYGGGMVSEVALNEASWADIPARFEAGTPNYADVIALIGALDYLEKIGIETIHQHELVLTAYALEQLKNLDGITILGPLDMIDRIGVISFYDNTIHPHDLVTILDREGIALRAGTHCAQPLLHRFGIEATARASFYLYNGKDDIDALIEGIKIARRLFSHVK